MERKKGDRREGNGSAWGEFASLTLGWIVPCGSGSNLAGMFFKLMHIN